MTALDDFIADHDRAIRCLVLPIYFGLAIVVEEERLASTPALAATLDHLESAAGRLELMELAEDTRIQAMVFQHNVFYQREERARTARGARYLEVVKAALLNEHYLENEVRLDHLTERLRTGRAGEREPPARSDTGRPPRLRAARATAPRRRRSRRRRRELVRAVHRDGTRTPRSPRDVPRRGPRRRESKATWSSAAPGAAVARSSCAPISMRTRSPSAACGWPIGSARPRRQRPRSSCPETGDRRVPRRSEPRPRRLRSLRPARRPGPVPGGRARRHAARRSDRRVSPCCGSDAASTPTSAQCSRSSTTGSPTAAS